MRVILDDNVLFQLFDASHNLAQEHRTSDSGHILDTDFITAGFNQLLGHIQIIFNSMDR